MYRATFEGTVYFSRSDYTDKGTVCLGTYTLRRGHAAALKKLEKLYPGGWLYTVSVSGQN